MTKLLMGVGALLMVSAAVPANAHDWNGYDNGYGYNGYGNGYGYNSDYDVIRQHVRACRQHERFHQALAEVHDQMHDQGFDSNGEHRDVHEALDSAHDAYHETHGDPQDCGYWYSQYDRWNSGYGYRNRYHSRYHHRPYGWSYQYQGY
jgi:Arc/MetJ-type ribon-helix-helix transcriptional regulator